jgi:hypothetical protein
MYVRSGARRIRKGYETVLKERGRWPNGSAKFLGVCKLCKKEKTRGYTGNVDLTRRKCSATRMIAAEPDFVEQRSQIEELIRKRGHSCLFYPKYHCELNYIEMYWGWAKRYTNSTFLPVHSFSPSLHFAHR